MTPVDISRIPPVASGDQIREAFKTLEQFRRALKKKKHSPELTRWLCACLAEDAKQLEIPGA